MKFKIGKMYRILTPAQNGARTDKGDIIEPVAFAGSIILPYKFWLLSKDIWAFFQKYAALQRIVNSILIIIVFALVIRRRFSKINSF